MTMKMTMDYPGLFAAAVPDLRRESLQPAASLITDAELAADHHPDLAGHLGRRRRRCLRCPTPMHAHDLIPGRS